MFPTLSTKQEDFIKSLKKNTKIKRISSAPAQTPSENQYQRMTRNQPQWEHPTPTQKAPQSSHHKYHLDKNMTQRLKPKSEKMTQL